MLLYLLAVVSEDLLTVNRYYLLGGLEILLLLLGERQHVDVPPYLPKTRLLVVVQLRLELSLIPWRCIPHRLPQCLVLPLHLLREVLRGGHMENLGDVLLTR